MKLTTLITIFAISMIAPHARAVNLEGIAAESTIRFNENVNIRPKIGNLYWQDGHMVDSIVDRSDSQFCRMDFQASTVDRALSSGTIFKIARITSQQNSTYLVLTRQGVAGAVGLSCYEIKKTPRSGVTAYGQPRNTTRGLSNLSIEEFNKITGGDFTIQHSAAIDFETSYPKPVPGDQRIVDPHKMRATVVVNQKVLINSYDGYFHSARFVDGKIAGELKHDDVVCRMRNSKSIELPAGSRADMNNKDDDDKLSLFWMKVKGDTELIHIDCERMRLQSWDGQLGTNHDDPPTVAEMQKAFGNIVTIRIKDNK